MTSQFTPGGYTANSGLLVAGSGNGANGGLPVVGSGNGANSGLPVVGSGYGPENGYSWPVAAMAPARPSAQ